MNLNEHAPEFSLPDLDGTIHSLRDFRGRLVIANFWSATCPHCVRTDPVILSIAAQAGEAIVVAAIASNRSETAPELADAARARAIPLVLRDDDEHVADLYDARTTPHVFLVDADGILRYRGAVDPATARWAGASKAYLDEAVQALLAGQIPTVQETPAFGCAIIRYI